MEQKKKSFKDKLKNLNIRWGVALLFLLANIAAGGYYFYMITEVNRVEKVLENKQKELALTKRELADIRANDGYKRYQAAKIVKQSSDMMDWLESTQYLIAMLNTMYALDEEDDSMELDQVVVWEGTVSLSGKTSALQTVYREWWVIDTFMELPFVHEFDIPWYTNSEKGVWFTLSAKVEGYDW